MQILNLITIELLKLLYEESFTRIIKKPQIYHIIIFKKKLNIYVDKNDVFLKKIIKERKVFIDKKYNSTPLYSIYIGHTLCIYVCICVY